MFGMPPILTALFMTFELGAYGAFAGIFYKLLPKKTVYLYVALILAMLAGRAVYGIANLIILGVSGSVLRSRPFLPARLSPPGRGSSFTLS